MHHFRIFHFCLQLSKYKMIWYFKVTMKLDWCFLVAWKLGMLSVPFRWCLKYVLSISNSTFLFFADKLKLVMSFLITSVFPPTLLLIHFLLVALFANEQLQFRLWLYVALLSTSGMISYSSLFFYFSFDSRKAICQLR